jgi:hypothetical protein
MIADLVGRQALGSRAFAGQVEQVGGQIVVERREQPVAHQRGKARARLDGQLVKRKMVGAEG